MCNGLDCEAVSASLCSTKKEEHFCKLKIREEEGDTPSIQMQSTEQQEVDLRAKKQWDE